MDPNTVAALEVLKLALHIVRLAMEGQTVEQRAEMWRWYVDDTRRLRKFLKLDE